jgi:hypothetical protein
MLHIGVVFLVFGVFLLGAGLIPDDVTSPDAWSIFGKKLNNSINVELLKPLRERACIV